MQPQSLVYIFVSLHSIKQSWLETIRQWIDSHWGSITRNLQTRDYCFHISNRVNSIFPYTFSNDLQFLVEIASECILRKHCLISPSRTKFLIENRFSQSVLYYTRLYYTRNWNCSNSEFLINFKYWGAAPRIYLKVYVCTNAIAVWISLDGTFSGLILKCISWKDESENTRTRTHTSLKLKWWTDKMTARLEWIKCLCSWHPFGIRFSQQIFLYNIRWCEWRVL